MHAVGSLVPIMDGYIGCIVIKPGGNRYVASAVPDPAGRLGASDLVRLVVPLGEKVQHRDVLAVDVPLLASAEIENEQIAGYIDERSLDRRPLINTLDPQRDGPRADPPCGR